MSILPKLRWLPNVGHRDRFLFFATKCEMLTLSFWVVAERTMKRFWKHAWVKEEAGKFDCVWNNEYPLLLTF